jgi:hypothetical protein
LLLVLATVRDHRAVPPSSAEESAAGRGLTLEELVARTGAPPQHLRSALSSEVSAGRVVLAPDGRYSLVAAAFSPAVLAALRQFNAPSASGSVSGRSPLARTPARDGRLNPHEREALDRLALMPVFGDGRATSRAGIASDAY